MDFASSARALADQYDRQAERRDENEGMDQENDDDDDMVDRMELFMPVVQRLVGALGGFEEVENPETGEIETVYRPGDSALAVMRDLKRLWRKDDTDDERTVFRCFAKAGLCTELVSLLDECTGRGQSGRKMALAATDLLAALTWPIDVQQELKDMLEDAETVVTDYASLRRSQVEYKALIMKSGSTIRNLMVLLLPSLALSNRDRTERDKRIVSLMLYLIRNLLAIRDPIGSGVDSGDTMELGSMQSRLIVQLEEARFLPLLLTLAENAGKGEYEEYNVLVLDSLWLMFRAVEVDDLLKESSHVAAEALAKLLDEEDRSKQQAKRTGNSRHSRFGTTIVMKAGSDRYVLHKQSSISTTAGAVLDGIKRKRAGKLTKQDELTLKAGGVTALNQEALAIMKPFARQFLFCFDNFFHSILKDIRMGRAKIRDTDNLRVLYLCRFFMEYFLALQQQEQDNKARREKEREAAKRQAEKSRDPFADLGLDDDALMAELDKQPTSNPDVSTDATEPDSELDFRLLAEVFQDETRGWLGRRLGEAKDLKPRGDLEIQACLDFFTQLLLVIAAMSNDKDEEILELSDTLSAKLLQNAEFIETAYDCLKTYKNQSMAYLDSAINFCYTLIRTLEVYSKDRGHIHIRKKREINQRKKNKQSDHVNMDDEEEQAAALEKATATYTEHARQFRDFERALADERIVSTLIRYLSRYREFNDAKKLKRLVSLMHRIVVSVGADAFFYKVSGFEVFKKVLEDQRSLPAGQATKDLLACINFILRKFFKNLQQNPLLAVEAFWPKPRGQLRKLSGSNSDGDDSNDDLGRVKTLKVPADLEFKPDKEFTWSQKLGIAIRCLLDDRKIHWVMWLVEVLRLVCVERQEIILTTDGEPRAYDPDLDDTRPRIGPSEEAKEKLADHIVRPDTEEQAKALVYNPHLKLLCTMVEFEQSISDEPEEEFKITWTVPKKLLPQEIESSIRIIEGFMREPMDLNGMTPAELLRRKRRKRPAKRRRRDSVDVERAPRRRKQADEVQQKKSAQFIDDSDDDPEADAAFFAREAANREANRKNISLGFTKSSRRQPENDQRSESHLVQVTNQASPRSAGGQDDNESIQSDDSGPSPIRQVPGLQRPRPRARQRQKLKSAAGSQSLVGPHRSDPTESGRSDEDSEDTDTVQRGRASARKRVVTASSEEDEADL